MALTKLKKETIIEDVVGLLETAKATVLVDYQGLTVAQLQSLRKIVSEKGCQARVVKNRLVQKALASKKISSAESDANLVGMLLYVFSFDDEIAGAQAVAEFLKQNPEIKLEFKGVVFADGKFSDGKTAKKLSQLSSKEQMLAELVATLSGQLPSVVNSLGQQLPVLIASLEADKQ